MLQRGRRWTTGQEKLRDRVGLITSGDCGKKHLPNLALARESRKRPFLVGSGTIGLPYEKYGPRASDLRRCLQGRIGDGKLWRQEAKRLAIKQRAHRSALRDRTGRYLVQKPSCTGRTGWHRSKMLGEVTPSTTDADEIQRGCPIYRIQCQPDGRGRVEVEGATAASYVRLPNPSVI
jgi:hypothetical protein